MLISDNCFGVRSENDLKSIAKEDFEMIKAFITGRKRKRMH